MRFVRRRLGRVLLGAALGVGLLGAQLAYAPESRAQSAADKATARQLATEGIEAFKAEKFAEALDKLQRAQQLYDAPVHLIYIARCHVKLGQLVEAAEAYRKLVRTQLPDNAPSVFKDAVADAKKELPEVEPKIASLRIDVEPTGVQGLELRIDDAPVSTAVLGVDRPVNPGSRKIAASAPGFKTLEQTLELKPGEKRKLALTLEPDGTSPATGPVAGGAQGAKDGGGGAGKEGDSAAASDAAMQGNVGFVVGLRLGATIPAGDIARGYPIKDYFGPGGGAELRGGVRVFKRYSILLLGGVDNYQPGSYLEEGPPGTTIKALALGTNAGVGAMYAWPPGKLGPFAELAFLFTHDFEARRDVDWKNADDCAQTLRGHGNAFRLSGGVQIPVLDWLQLSPYAGLTLGSVKDFGLDDTCKDDQVVPVGPTPGRYPNWKKSPWWQDADPKTTTHLVVSLGVGGDIVFGSDKPSK